MAFTVTPQVNVTYSPSERVLFDNVITNEGEAFIPTQNVFLCPIDGVYYFSYTALTNYRQTGLSAIYMDGTLLVSSYCDNAANSVAANSVLIFCPEGAIVYVQCEASESSDSCHLSGSGVNYSSFSGFLVSEQL